tara:strand:+ start:47 stop:1429 length:1383 start_codon:yes stop_codon:yes gene_type:complete
MYAINKTLKRTTARTLDETWISQAVESPTVAVNIKSIRNFFIFWKAQDPLAISNEALELLIKLRIPRNKNRNVLSDDPEKSWLSDEEYEAVLASVWRNYEEGQFSASRTLLALLSMQYARRPVQLANLKIKDFRIAAKGDISGLTGPLVSFPGAKDLNAETGFRDSRFEHHPLPSHLWSLFEIHRKEIRAMIELHLGSLISDSDFKNLPVFTDKNRIKAAISVLTDHYKLVPCRNLDHQLFHLRPTKVSQTLAWRPGGRIDIEPPLSHRTNRPILVNATRLRHTRARQLARKGVPLHTLSHWLGHTQWKSLQAYYNDPAEDARKLDQALAPALAPLAMAFAGNLIDNEQQASRLNDPTSRLEFAKSGELKNVGSCGNHSYCATTSIPIPCYRCKHFEPLVSAPHQEVLEALKTRQEEENQSLCIGGARNLLVPIDLSADILAVQNCIRRCEARKIELGLI